MTARKTNLADPIYHNKDAARAHLEGLLWPHGPQCPACGVLGDRITKLQGKSTRPGVYKCKDCRKPFTVTIGTVMERSHVPLHKWNLAAHFMAASKKGMSALQLQRMLGTNYETAWFLFHRLRECPKGERGPMGGEGKFIEADETFVGGKEKNKHANKRIGRSMARDTKKAVVTLIEREGEARSFHVANVTAKTIRTVLVTNASRSSHLMTDGGTYYLGVAPSTPRTATPIMSLASTRGTGSFTRTRRRASSPSSSAASTATSTASAKLTCIAIWSSSTSAGRRGSLPMWSGRKSFSKARRASG